MSDIQHRIDEYAAEVDYTAHAERFLQLDRWTGDDPLLLLADAAGTTTGQSYFTHVKPSVEAFQTHFLETDRITSFAELASLNQQDTTLEQIFEAQRKRRVLVEGADVLANIDAETDLVRLQEWAHHADPTNHSMDPFGGINGVGLRTFQYLRMIAGIDTVKPDIQVKRFVETLAEETGDPHLDPSRDQTVLESCQWLAEETDYRMIELDQIAWWHFSETAERHAADTLDQ
jgi:hypothetical protein